jgi:hypothetical protein
MKKTIVTFLLLLAFAGCATLQSDKTVNTEEILAAAGFKKKVADTPEKLADLKTRIQHRLVAYRHEDGDLRFVYADASGCKCMYAGKQKAYEKYQLLAVEKKIAEDKRIVVNENVGGPFNWYMWGGDW